MSSEGGRLGTATRPGGWQKLPWRCGAALAPPHPIRQQIISTSFFLSRFRRSQSSWHCDQARGLAEASALRAGKRPEGGRLGIATRLEGKLPWHCTCTAAPYHHDSRYTYFVSAGVKAAKTSSERSLGAQASSQRRRDHGSVCHRDLRRSRICGRWQMRHPLFSRAPALYDAAFSVRKMCVASIALGHDSGCDRVCDGAKPPRQRRWLQHRSAKRQAVLSHVWACGILFRAHLPTPPLSYYFGARDGYSGH